jgi:polyphosphate glucokinase
MQARTVARTAIGIDFGGTGVKAALVDVDRGHLMMEKVRVLTPRPATPEVCIPLVRDLADRVLATAPVPVPTDVPVGLGFPAVVVAGSPRTAAHVDRSWIGYPLAPSLQRAMGRPVAIDNDADAAGAAEMRFGAGAGVPGMVVMVTLGTGIGTSLFVDGHHVPNTELGHLSMRGRDAEFWASGAARKRRNLGWDRWAEDLDEHLRF